MPSTKYLVVFGSAVLCYAALGAVLGILPGYVKGLGGDAVLVGIAVGAPAVTGAAGRPLGGRLADHHGPARIMMFGAAVMVAGTIPAFIISLPVLLASRLLVGAGEASMMAAAVLWLLRLAGPGRRGRAMGHIGLANYAGLTVGPPLSHALAGHTHPSRVWIAAAMLPLIAAGMTAVISRRPQRGEPDHGRQDQGDGDRRDEAECRQGTERAEGKQGTERTEGQEGTERTEGQEGTERTVGREGTERMGGKLGTKRPEGQDGIEHGTLRRTLRPGLGLMLVNFGYVALLSFGAAAATQRRTGIAELVIPVFGAGVIASRTILAGIPDRFGAARTLSAAVVAESVGLAGLAAMTSSPLALASLVVMALGQGLAVPSLGLIALASVPPSRHGRTAGAFFAYFDAGVGLGGLAVGVAARAADPTGALFAAAAAVLATAPIALLRVPARRRVGARQTLGRVVEG